MIRRLTIIALLFATFATPATASSVVFQSDIGSKVDLILPLADGTLLVAGRKTTSQAPEIIRLKADGTVDPRFSATAAAPFRLLAAAQQSDGKILLVCLDDRLDKAESKVVRILRDGELDTSFRYDAKNKSDLLITCIALQADGKVVLGGEPWELEEKVTSALYRLNGDGSLDARFEPGEKLDGVRALVALKGGALLAGGYIRNGDLSVGRLLKLEGDGKLDKSFANTQERGKAISQVVAQQDGRLLVLESGLREPVLKRILADGTPDKTFSCRLIQDPIGDEPARIALQADGRILVAGSILVNPPDKDGDRALVRLTASGEFDKAYFPDFIRDSGIFDPTAMAVLPNQDVVLGARWHKAGTTFGHGVVALKHDPSPSIVSRTDFREITSADRSEDGCIVISYRRDSGTGTKRLLVERLKADLTPDPAFKTPAEADREIFAVRSAANGRLLMAGEFNRVNGRTCPGIARLLADGTVDTEFKPPLEPGTWCASAHELPDGKVLLIGGLKKPGGSDTFRIVRLNSDGSLDEAFDHGSGTDGVIVAMAVQPDGKILVAGTFTKVCEVDMPRIARLLPNGGLDRSFKPGRGFDARCMCVAVQADGKVLVGGQFKTYDGTPRLAVARLNNDGSLDAGFDPGDGHVAKPGLALLVTSVALDRDGSIYISGSFTKWAGQPAGFVAHFTRTAPWTRERSGPAARMVRSGRSSPSPRERSCSSAHSRGSRVPRPAASCAFGATACWTAGAAASPRNCPVR